MSASENKLITVEEQFKLMADAAPILMWLAGTDKLCYFFNKGWLTFTGRTMEEEYGNGWTAGIHPNDLPQWLESYTVSFDTRKEFKIKYRLRRHDGQYRWMLDKGSPRYTADGTFAGYIGSCTDIEEVAGLRSSTDNITPAGSSSFVATLGDKLAISNEELAASNEELASMNEELNAANEQLQLSREELRVINASLEGKVVARTAELIAAQLEALNQRDRLKRFFLQAPAGICIMTGPDLVFELVNTFYHQLFPGRELLGKPVLEAVPEIKDQPIWDILQGVYHTGTTFEGNELLIPMARTDDGPVEERYFNFIYQPQRDLRDNVNGILVFVIEVTDTVLTKRAIQRSAEQFQMQLDVMPQIAWTNKPDGEVDFYNQQWYNYTGLDFEQTKAWGWREVIHPDDLQYNLDMYGKILSGNTGGEFEIREKRVDGVYRWHLVRMLPLKNEHGELIKWMGTATDIQDLKMLQAQKDDFISIASHELKTPVTSLRASLQLLNRMKDNPVPNIFPKLIDQANRSVEKIVELIDDLLDAGRLNESQLTINKKRFRIAELMENCCMYIRNGGKYELIFQGDKDLEVYGDEHRIDQVLSNFINNAVKYAPESKEIYLIAERHGDHIKIAVKDNGPGIAPDKIPHLFSKYYRAEYTGSQFSGLGLGLYISSEITKRHGGKIGVDSQLGHGSTFWILLPAA
ncbi:PAS domain S-box protein [Mucilaginibacter terrenus]|uniref:histidine kinase n=1 Tax=Mucilaginibacter terrenus TaxID=2482727 RepID=A0A3E2NK41_9SPHI|nr:ATP-binding protein [Mucilaginibacter terrenus]RFZ81367.1 PAS domain S-box protein [Mucilaginibacter terrenus]